MHKIGLIIASDNPSNLVEVLAALSTHDLSEVDVAVACYGEVSHVVYESANVLPLKNAGGYRVVDAEGLSRNFVVRKALQDVHADTVCVMSDTVRPSTGWLDELYSAFSSSFLRSESGDFPLPAGKSIDCIGPVSDGMALPAQRIELQESEVRLGIDGYAEFRRTHLGGIASAASQLHLACVMARKEWWWNELESDLGDYGLAYRFAHNAEAITAVAEGCYVALAEPERVGAWVAGDGEARLRYYETSRLRAAPSPKVVAAVRVKPTTMRSLELFKACIASMAPTVDGIAVALACNPLDVQDDFEFRQAHTAGRVDGLDQRLLKACGGATPRGCAEALKAWILDVCKASGRVVIDVEVSTHAGAPDEFSERVLAYQTAAKLHPTWLFIIEPDEMLEGNVTRDFLHRLASHPDPLVRAYDVSFVTHWNTPSQVRVDAPYGDKNAWTGGPSGVRLIAYTGQNTRPARTTDGGISLVPIYDESVVRVANVRLRRMGLLRASDRMRRGIVEMTESVTISDYANDTRMGFHCLTYENESIDDVGRWLDVAHGLCDAAVLVWTAEREPTEEWVRLAKVFGASLVHHPLRDHLANARNAGIEFLHKRGGLSWAWFVDPDEWLSDTLKDSRALRRMTEASRYGWLVQTCNYRTGEAPNISDSVRVSRLDAAGEIRMDGRVHEGFSDAWKKLQARGIHPRLVYAPFVVQHRGMSFSPERMREKLDKYDRLLRLEISDRPHNPGAWVSLAHNYMHDGHPAEGEQCLRNAVDCGGMSYLPYRELGYLRLREGKDLLKRSIERLAPSHQWYKLAAQLVAVLDEQVPGDVVVASPSKGECRPLPHYPSK